jgi:hypothetical protein
MKKINSLFLLGILSAMLVIFPILEAEAAGKPDDDTIEVQIPKPKFEIFQAWQYGGFWTWDEKDPRFFKEFLKKIHESLYFGPF